MIHRAGLLRQVEYGLKHSRAELDLLVLAQGKRRGSEIKSLKVES
jgi:hypothetical protein